MSNFIGISEFTSLTISTLVSVSPWVWFPVGSSLLFPPWSLLPWDQFQCPAQSSSPWISFRNIYIKMKFIILVPAISLVNFHFEDQLCPCNQESVLPTWFFSPSHLSHMKSRIITFGQTIAFKFSFETTLSEAYMLKSFCWISIIIQCEVESNRDKCSNISSNWSVLIPSLGYLLMI